MAGHECGTDPDVLLLLHEKLAADPIIDPMSYAMLDELRRARLLPKRGALG